MFMDAPDTSAIERHGHRVSVRQDQADEFAILRADAAKKHGVLAYPMVDYLRRQPEEPSTGLIAHPAKPASSSNISPTIGVGSQPQRRPLWPEVF